MPNLSHPCLTYPTHGESVSPCPCQWYDLLMASGQAVLSPSWTHIEPCLMHDLTYAQLVLTHLLCNSPMLGCQISQTLL